MGSWWFCHWFYVMPTRLTRWRPKKCAAATPIRSRGCGASATWFPSAVLQRRREPPGRASPFRPCPSSSTTARAPRFNASSTLARLRGIAGGEKTVTGLSLAGVGARYRAHDASWHWRKSSASISVQCRTADAWIDEEYGLCILMMRRADDLFDREMSRIVVRVLRRDIQIAQRTRRFAEDRATKAGVALTS